MNAYVFAYSRINILETKLKVKFYCLVNGVLKKFLEKFCQLF